LSGEAARLMNCVSRGFDLDDRCDMGVPIGAGEGLGRCEDSDYPGFIAIAAMICAFRWIAITDSV
jgi:hypothetical protein